MRQKKRDRFGRIQYYNRETKKNQQEKPVHWYTAQEKEEVLKKEEEERKKELERKRKREEARIARIKPGLRKIQAYFKRRAETKAPAAVRKLQDNAEHPMIPCLAMAALDHDSVIQFYKKKDANIAQDIKTCYGGRRAVLEENKEAIEDEKEARKLVDGLFLLSRRWGTTCSRNEPRRVSLATKTNCTYCPLLSLSDVNI